MKANKRIRLHHAHLFASDLDKSIEFYCSNLGAELMGDEIFAGARNVMLRLGDGRLNFYDQAPRGSGSNGVHHLGIQTDDLDGLISDLKMNHVIVTNEIKGQPGARYIMVEAPDNVLLELFEIDSDLLSGGASKWFSWQPIESSASA